MTARVLGLAALALSARAALARRRETTLAGQVALVTGGSRGLGYLLARELLRHGCRVSICARDEAELEAAKARLQDETGGEIMTLACDVGRADDVSRWVEAARARLGPIDILVNNAGIIQLGAVRDMSRDDFGRAMDVMFWGVVHPTLAVLPEMVRRRSGRIVNITSIGAKVGVPGLLPYTAAKFAAIGFSEGLRAELARDGVHVMTVVPGLLRTGSDVQVEVKGREWQRRFPYLAVLANLPIVTMDAERAARRIVRATRRGESETILTFPAELLTRIHGIAPGITGDALGVVGRFLPRADDRPDEPAAHGRDLIAASRSPLLDRLRSWNDSAARRFNEHPGGRRGGG